MALAAFAAGIVFIHLGLFGLDRTDVAVVDQPAVLPTADEAVARN
jgi:hypothetical protein